MKHFTTLVFQPALVALMYCIYIVCYPCLFYLIIYCLDLFFLDIIILFIGRPLNLLLQTQKQFS